jgi:hypothetical protein
MGLRIEHRTEDGVMILSTPFTLDALASRVVGTGEELVVVNERTGSTLARFTVPPPGPAQTGDEQPISEPTVDPGDALARHGLDGDFDTLMTEVERQGWYVIPTPTSSPSRRAAAAIRRVVLGVGSRESHVTVDGRGRTIVEALGWAVARALDAHARPVAV